MTHEPATVRRQQPPPDGTGAAGGDSTSLTLVQEHIVELLARLDRPPRHLRVRAGQVTVDITWAVPSGPSIPSAPGERAAAGLARAGDEQGEPRPDARAGGPVEHHLTSPSVGVFYHASQPGAEPFVSVGSTVHPGQQVGIVEAMKLMIPVEAGRAGRIVKVLKGNGEPVEYAEPLFALDVEEA